MLSTKQELLNERVEVGRVLLLTREERAHLEAAESHEQQIYVAEEARVENELELDTRSSDEQLALLALLEDHELLCGELLQCLQSASHAQLARRRPEETAPCEVDICDTAEATATLEQSELPQAQSVEERPQSQPVYDRDSAEAEFQLEEEASASTGSV